MMARRPAFALALLILFGIGGVAAPVAHEADHARQSAHAHVHDAEAPALTETPSEHGPCLCAVPLIALSTAQTAVPASNVDAPETLARPSVAACANGAARGDRGPPASVRHA